MTYFEINDFKTLQLSIQELSDAMIGDVISIPPPKSKVQYFAEYASGRRVQIRDFPKCAYCGTEREEPEINCVPCGATLTI